MLSLARRLGRRYMLVLAAVFAVGLLGAFAASSAAAAPQALILGSTVSPGTATDGSGVSLEQQQAQADGFTVTVVDDATWSSMTAAQFAAYQVIIIGDPTCDNTVQAGSVAESNKAVWEPVVMSSGGNKVLVGTDPTYHNDGPGGSHRGDLLEAKGIAFAGAISGATGAYIDLSCTYDGSPPGTPVPILDGLSTHGSGQFTAGGAPCAGSISIVASSGPTSGLHDADLSDWSCSVHEFFDKFPSDYTPLALATDPSVPKTYGANDVDTGASVSGSPYIMVSGSGVTVSSDITLAPPTQSQDVGGPGTVTATVTHGGSPEAGKTVTFTVESGPNAGVTGTAVTDSNGVAAFTYNGSKGAGTDSLSATFTNDAGAAEKATATISWTPGIAATPGAELSAVESQSVSGPVATFTDSDPNATASEYSAMITWADGTTSPGTIDGSAGTFTVTGSHVYAEEGSPSISVTITDVDNSANSATVSTTAKVADAALHATGGTPVRTGFSVTGGIASFTDDDAGGTVSDYSASINWGDGTHTPGNVTAGKGRFDVGGSHVYPRRGTFTVTVTITDAGGSSAQATDTVTITAVKPAHHQPRIVHGRARLSGVPSACTLSPATLRIEGRRILSVTWFVNGRRVHGLTVHRGTSYAAGIASSPGAHHVTVRVTFVQASRTRGRTFHAAVSGCRPVVPKFTG